MYGTMKRGWGGTPVPPVSVTCVSSLPLAVYLDSSSQTQNFPTSDALESPSDQSHPFHASRNGVSEFRVTCCDLCDEFMSKAELRSRPSPGVPKYIPSAGAKLPERHARGYHFLRVTRCPWDTISYSCL